MMKHLPKDAIIVRWIALGSAAGAAVSAAISLWRDNPIWLILSFIASLLAVSFIAALWNRFSHHINRANSNEVLTKHHIQEVNALQFELNKQKSLELELKKSKLNAESAAMAKSEFLATMSHEIRTPLNGVIPMLDLLSSSKLTDEQKEILLTARTSAMQMKQIVDDILDYSKLEANKLKLETTGLNIRDVVNTVVQMLRNQADVKGLTLSTSIDPLLRLALRGDPVRLRQVLSNLLSNAIKFTTKGSVQIVLTAKSETRQHHIIRFEIIDSGIGIAPESANRLFKALSQADTSTTRIYGGTGLGLVICKRIVDLMSGQIGVDSKPNIGSTFWFEVPMLKALGDNNGLASELKNSRILLLSSDPILSGKLERSNGQWGAKLSIAATTVEAQHVLKESYSRGDQFTFDLLLIDLNTVRNSAMQLQKTILNNPAHENLRMAFLHGLEAAPRELSKSPRCCVVPRSLDADALRAELNKLLSYTVSAASHDAEITLNKPTINIQTGGPTFLSGQRYGTVLLVEDNPVNLLVAQRLINLANFDFVSAENGERALELLQQQKFDLVLMDCQMPVLDGYKATQQWRTIEVAHAMPRIPIIAMTANAMAEDRQKCLDAGMDDYLSKPVDRRLLEQTLLTWLNKSPAVHKPIMTPSPVLPASPISNEALVPVTPVHTVESALDLEVVAELKEMMGSDYQSLVRIFLEDAPKLINQFQSGLRNNDCNAMIVPAHTLKSSSANLGAVRLSHLAMKIEQNARAGYIEFPRDNAQALVNEFNLVKVALHTLL